MNYREEVMSAEFTKHLFDFNGKNGNVHFVMHQFKAPDKGGPHDHPFSFTTHILKGGYKERVYKIQPNGFWCSEDLVRKPGTSFVVEATTIHELIELPEGECWTLVIPGPKVREPGFWRFEEETISFRQWNGHWNVVNAKKF